MPYDDMTDAQIVAALESISYEYALESGVPTSLATRNLYGFLADHGAPLDESFTIPAAEAAQAGRAVFDAIANDEDLVALRPLADAALARARSRIVLPQDLGVTAVAGVVVIALALVAKLEIKDGKWTLHPGLPGFDKAADVLKSLLPW